MCLLIHHTPDSEVEPEFLADVFSKNSDGFGVMFGTGDRVAVHKRLPSGPEEIIKYYNKKIKGRECVIHFRMRTHGDVDLKNAHPYRVTEDLWMAHNGVLSIGNSHNPKMSDTWHLIQLYLRPMLEGNPDLLFTPAFQKMLGGFIGTNNKLGFVHKSGKVVLINESAGVQHKNMWLSNTYAWSYGRPATTYGRGYNGGWYGEEYGGNYGQYYGSNYGRRSSGETTSTTVGKTTTTTAPAVPASGQAKVLSLPAPDSGQDAEDLRAIGEALRRGDQETLVRRFLEGKGVIPAPAKSAAESAEVFESAYQNVGGEVVAVDEAMNHNSRMPGVALVGEILDDEEDEEALMSRIGWV
jgi:hypothetical protein